MADLSGFDANTVEPASVFEPIPAGHYAAIIIESERKANKAGTGHYLQFTFEVIDGPHQGRFLWARLNLDNPNVTAVQIAKAELSAICRAVGVLAPNDSIDLHDLPLTIKVGLKKRPDTSDLNNEIRGYSPKSSLAVSTASAKPAAAPTPASNGKPTTPPWKR